MNHVWHVFESLGNIVVFFLAGAITGWTFSDIDMIDWLNLLLIYLVLSVIRGGIIFGSMPMLQYLSADNLPVSWQDATLMTWGGLRGAVGLALAIQVNNGRAPDEQGSPQIDEKDAQRLLFFVSGIVFMTTLLNAFTAPFLVQKLGIIALPEARQTLLRLFYQQLVNYSHYNDNPEEVTAALKEMLHEAAEEIEHQQTSKTGPRCTRHADAEGSCILTPKLHQNREDAEGAMPETHFIGMPSQLWTGGPSCPRPAGMQDGCVDGNIRVSGLSMDSAVIDSSVIASHMDSSLTSTQFQANDEMLHELKVLRHKYKKIPQDELRLLGGELPENLLD